MLDRRTVHLPDLAEPIPDDPLDHAWLTTPPPATGPLARGVRTYLGVPLLRDSAVIGLITLTRKDVQPFSNAQVALIEAFADQAIIAIENARLFTELRERDERWVHELEQARAIQSHLLPAGGGEQVAGGIWSDVAALRGAESHHDDMTLLVPGVPAPVP